MSSRSITLNLVVRATTDKYIGTYALNVVDGKDINIEGIQRLIESGDFTAEFVGDYENTSTPTLIIEEKSNE